MAGYPYNTARWRKLRQDHLSAFPLCWYCDQMGMITTADTVDHIQPHKGDFDLTWQWSNLRSCCKRCHDSAAALKDNLGYVPGVDADGYPIDDDHPWKRGDTEDD